MEEKEIIEGNKLIAEFMGDSWHISEHDNYVNYGNYHRKWDNLMPVVEKINKLGRMVNINFWTNTNTGQDEVKPSVECKIYTWLPGAPTIEVEKIEPIEAVYQAVIDFIHYHNKNKGR